MASDILHIKDGYYFEVPRVLYPAHYTKTEEFRDSVGHWFVRNDDDYQDWEAEHIIAGLTKIGIDGAHTENITEKWHDWKHSNEMRHGRPLDRYINDQIAILEAKAATWSKTQTEQAPVPLQAYIASNPEVADAWMATLVLDPVKSKAWKALQRDMDAHKLVDDYIATERGKWSKDKIESYNNYLSGKVFIPQPFGEIRNAYERESGFAISKFMIIEVIVAILLFIAFTWLAGKISTGAAPKGKRWNLLESFLVFIRNDVVLRGWANMTRSVHAVLLDGLHVYPRL